ncbi:hypothetical protein AAMO2058_001246900 [Amorphochlora amoebiformis]
MYQISSEDDQTSTCRPSSIQASSMISVDIHLHISPSVREPKSVVQCTLDVPQGVLYSQHVTSLRIVQVLLRLW